MLALCPATSQKIRGVALTNPVYGVFENILCLNLWVVIKNINTFIWIVNRGKGSISWGQGLKRVGIYPGFGGGKS